MMKNIIFIISLLFVLTTIPQILQGGEDQTAIKILEGNKTRIKFIYFALTNTYEFHSHNLGENSNNKVYTNKDGHKEAVYDKTGKLVTDCLNKGSYNFFPAHIAPLKHFSTDILPWINFGNCPNDKSTKKERAEAFSKDFTDGCFRVITNWKRFEKENDIDESKIREIDQINTLKTFLNILNSMEFKQYKFDGTDTWMADQQQYDLFYLTLKMKITEELSK